MVGQETGGRADLIRRANRRRSEEVLAALLTEVGPAPVRTLIDVGCGDTSLSATWGDVTRAACVIGVDVNRGHFDRPKVPVLEADLELGSLPVRSDSVDVVVANQVLEHLKNIHHAVAECNRILRPGGFLAVGLPNLASAHNRALLLAGRQPTFIQVRSPHVRGLTWRETLAFLEAFGFRPVRSRGAGFYPLRGRPMKLLDRVLPSAAAFQCHVMVKRQNVPVEEMEVFATADTNFRRGNLDAESWSS
jgi:SAM-dependent methyltransferase